MLTAQDIYQTHLDAVSTALWSWNFEHLLDHIRFPSFMETDDELLRMDKREDYLPSLHSFRKKLQNHGATAYHRICREAMFASDDPNRIEGIHETYALAGATPVMEPYLNHMTLVHQNGRWLGAGIRAAASNKDWMIIKHPEPASGSTASPADRQE